MGRVSKGERGGVFKNKKKVWTVCVFVWRMNLIGGSGWCLIVGCSRRGRIWVTLVDEIGGSPRRFDFFSQKKQIHPPNSPISLLAKGSRRNQSKFLERFFLSSQGGASMLNQRFGLYQIRFLKFGFLLTYQASEEEVWTPQEGLIFFFSVFIIASLLLID